MAIIVKCRKCKQEIEGKACLLLIPVNKEEVTPYAWEDLNRKIHVCNDCMDKIEEFIGV